MAQLVYVSKEEHSQVMHVFVPQIISNITEFAIYVIFNTVLHAVQILFVMLA